MGACASTAAASASPAAAPNPRPKQPAEPQAKQQANQPPNPPAGSNKTEKDALPTPFQAGRGDSIKAERDTSTRKTPLCTAQDTGLLPSKPSINPTLRSRPWIIGETPDIRTVYEFGAVLGKGQFGTTRVAKPWAGGEQVACKSISKRKLSTPEDVEDVQREVQVLHHLSGHPHVIQIRGVFEDVHYVHILMEVANGGELFDRIVQRGHYSEKDAAGVFRTMVAVVAHCHQMGVMHRDLKPENFLLSDSSAQAVLKATDFGLSVFFKEGQTFKEIVGSAYYVAPEVLKRCYGKEADIWSLGILLYILLSGVPPFYGESEPQIFQEVLTGKLDLDSAPWPAVSAAAKDLIRKLLVREPHKRLTAQQVLDNPWVRPGGVASAQPIQSEVVKRLQGFAAMNRLKKEALKIMVGFMPENEIRGLQAMFKSIDADGSGSITVDELRAALKAKGHLIPEADIAKLLAAGDVNGNGTLDYEEFLAATLHESKLQQEEHLYRVFQVLDVDGSGFIDRQELMQALGPDAVTELDTLLAQVDTNSDGQIDYEEFCAMMRASAEKGSAVGSEGKAGAPEGRVRGGALAGTLTGRGARSLRVRMRDRADLSVVGDTMTVVPAGPGPKPTRLAPL